MGCASLQAAADFNVFVLNNQNQGNVDCEGRVAVGGIATYDNYTIGDKLTMSTSRADLIVGKGMNITGGSNLKGNSVLGTVGQLTKYTMVNNNGVKSQPLRANPIDFSAEQSYLWCLTEQLSKQESNGQVIVQPWGALVLKGTNTTINIFNFDGTNINGSGLKLSTVNGIDIQVPSGSTVLINVTGTTLGMQNYSIFMNGKVPTATEKTKIFWNMPQAINLTASGISIQGSMLAPYATANFNNGNFEGTLIVLNLYGNMEEHLYLFTGCLPDIQCGTKLGIVGNLVWNDVNRNGTVDIGEAGVGNVTATLYTCAGAPTGLSTTSNASGFYNILNVPAGNYYVQFSNLPTNYEFVTTNNLVTSDGKTSCFTLAAGEYANYLDAPIAIKPNPTGSIGDFVWIDSNRNGVKDLDEVPLEGVTATLYKCDGTPTGKSAVTNSNGIYNISGVEAGSYYVQFSGIPANYEFVTTGNLVDINGKTICKDLVAGGTNYTFDAPVAPLPGTIGDLVWNDKNRDGVVDTGENGVADVTVTLYKCDGTSVTSTTTDSDGNYEFTDIDPGQYYVIFSDIPSGYEFITAGGYVDDTGRTIGCFTLNPAETLTNIDAPIAEIPVNPATIEGYAWDDADRSGTKDAGEDGLSDVTVTLLYKDGSPTGLSAVTDDSGNFSITGIAPGEYYVAFGNLPLGYEFVTVGDHVNSIGETPSFTLASGETLSTVIAPAAKAPIELASIGDLVWNDVNRNGVFDTGESGVPNATVTLFNCDGSPTGLSATTDTDGQYSIINIQPGSYYAVFSDIPSDFEFVTVGDHVDADGRTPECFTLTAGEAKDDVDAPIAIKQATIGDTVFYDNNRNGMRDPGEIGVPGVVVTLYKCDTEETPVAFAVTDADGMYSISNIEPGEYLVKFTGIPASYEFVPITNYLNIDGVTECFTLSPGEVRLDIDAPIAKPEGGVGSIGDFVWYDANKNGIHDPDEYGIPGVVATLYNCGDNSQVGEPLMTNANGVYRFTGLTPGNYYVQFTSIPAGFRIETEADLVNAEGKTDCIELKAGDVNNSADCPLVKTTGTVGYTVWIDTDKNSEREINEVGYPDANVKLYLCDSKLDTPYSATTDINGIYHIQNVLPNKYYAVFSNISSEYEFVTSGGLVSADGESSCFTLGEEQTINTVNAPLALLSGNVSGTVWDDVNESGTIDEGEKV